MNARTLALFLALAAPLAAEDTPAPVGTPAPAASSAPAAPFVEGLTFVLPEGWTAVEPRSPMRKAQASVPGPGGAATLTVFHFGPGGGGGVEANLARWEGQLIPDAGATPERKHLEGTGTTIYLTSLDGTLKPSRMSGVPSPVPGSRLLGAVVEGEGGPWFFKVTGPAMTVRLAMPDFVQMLAGAKVGPAG